MFQCMLYSCSITDCGNAALIVLELLGHLLGISVHVNVCFCLFQCLFLYIMELSPCNCKVDRTSLGGKSWCAFLKNEVDRTAHLRWWLLSSSNYMFQNLIPV